MKHPRSFHIALAALPLLLTPVAFWLLGEWGLGGGEKDVLFGFVWGGYWLLFWLLAGVMIFRHWPWRRWLRWALGLSVGILAGLWLLAFAASHLGLI